MDFSYELGQLNGRLDSHDREIGGMRDQLADIHGSVGRLEGSVGRVEDILKRIAESGPHPILVPQQNPLEMKGSSSFSRINILLRNPHFLHLFYGVILLILALWMISAYTGRSIDTFVGNPWDKTSARPPAHSPAP